MPRESWRAGQRQEVRAGAGSLNLRMVSTLLVYNGICAAAMGMMVIPKREATMCRKVSNVLPCTWAMAG